MTEAITPYQAEVMTTTLRQAVDAVVATSDYSVWDQSIRAGYQMIDTLYDPHPIKRPLDVLRRWQARRWWKHEVAANSRFMMGKVQEAQMRAAVTKLNRPLDQADINFHEENRRTRVTFDTDEEIRREEGKAMAQAKAQIAVEEARAALNPTPKPETQIELLFRMIAEVEQNPALTQDEKQRRLAVLQGQRDLLSGSR